MSRPTVVLPSPYLGPVGYGPLADALAAEVAALPPEPFTAAEVLEAFREATASAGLVVAHSNAGLYAAAIGRPCVFVDAALPAASGGRTPLAPPELARVLEGRADADGLLPQWTRWWPREEIAPLLPDPWFDIIDAAAPRVPAAYRTQTLEVPADWGAMRAAYLAFGDGYVREQAIAEELGWPTRRVAGSHLLHVTDPDGVARAVADFGLG